PSDWMGPVTFTMVLPDGEPKPSPRDKKTVSTLAPDSTLITVFLARPRRASPAFHFEAGIGSQAQAAGINAPAIDAQRSAAADAELPIGRAGQSKRFARADGEEGAEVCAGAQVLVLCGDLDRAAGPVETVGIAGQAEAAGLERSAGSNVELAARG